MTDYYSEAVVLESVPVGEADRRVSFYTRRYGRITARARSARKITSKLGPHLEAGNLLATRIVEKKGLRVVDALKRRRLSHGARDLAFLNALLHDGAPDERIWQLLAASAFAWKRILALLGWDPAGASCASCARVPVAFFEVGRHEFFCDRCVDSDAAPNASKVPLNALVSIG